MPVDTSLLIAGALIALIGMAHSVLGERYILMRLFRRSDIPHLFGGPEFTKRTLRFTWHITTVAWFGFAAIVVLAASNQLSASSVLYVVGATFAVSAILAAVCSQLQHLSWVVFAAIAALVSLSAKALS